MSDKLATEQIDADNQPQGAQEGTHTPKAILLKQWRLFGLLAALVLLLGMGLYVLLPSGGGGRKDEADIFSDIKFDGASTVVDDNEIWVHKTENQFEEQAQQTQALQANVGALSHSTQAISAQHEQTTEAVASLSAEVGALKQLIAQMKGELSQQAEALAKQKAPLQEEGVGTQGPFEASSQDMGLLSEDQMQVDTVELTEHTEAAFHTDENYVPAGTYVKAVLLGGADASASVLSQANPTPMLLRLIEPGHLPGGGKSHLQDCMATAAVIGDISAERGKIRLERLSCVLPNHHIMELSVSGAVFGPGGKNGVRGQPVWREGAQLQRAFLTGAFSGLANGVTASSTTQSISALGSTQTVHAGDVFQYGAARGVSSAMDRLAQYHIKRAEQYHPVIQLGAGTVVDVVFLKGFSLGENIESIASQFSAQNNHQNENDKNSSEGARQQAEAWLSEPNSFNVKGSS